VDSSYRGGYHLSMTSWAKKRSHIEKEKREKEKQLTYPKPFHLERMGERKRGSKARSQTNGKKGPSKTSPSSSRGTCDLSSVISTMAIGQQIQGEFNET